MGRVILLTTSARPGENHRSNNIIAWFSQKLFTQISALGTDSSSSIPQGTSFRCHQTAPLSAHLSSDGFAEPYRHRHPGTSLRPHLAVIYFKIDNQCEGGLTLPRERTGHLYNQCGLRRHRPNPCTSDARSHSDSGRPHLISFIPSQFPPKIFAGSPSPGGTTSLPYRWL